MPSPTDPDPRYDDTLFGALLGAAARHGGARIALRDADGQALAYNAVILGALVLGSRLVHDTRPGEAVGLLLPNVAGLPVALFGLNAHGRVAALLNFTAGARNLALALKAGPVPTIVTSRRFLATARLDDLVETLAATELTPGTRPRVVYLEDVRKEIGLADKAIGWLRSLYAGAFHASRRMRADKPAVILFTSGTEGAPKGVVLTNRNLVANARQIFTHAGGMLTPADIVFNPLPMFHSFGLTAATLMPMLNGLETVLYPSPLHYKEIPKRIRAAKASILFATDTFLQGYARAADAGDLASIRYVIAGAERVKAATRALWTDTGATILEGYGATECSPVIACNLPNAAREGSVGRLLPDIEARLEPVEGINEGGRLHVRGPNVMAGYVLPEHPGVLSPPRDGWHDTGDIVTIDDGFLTIRGRAKRFAKIGGEMVSLAAVESVAASLWPEHQHVVVAIADDRKGEQLVLLTDRPDADKAALLAHARCSGFPELWVPKAVLVVGQIPVLGSGKVDLAAARELARKSRPLL